MYILFHGDNTAKYVIFHGDNTAKYVILKSFVFIIDILNNHDFEKKK